MQLIERQATVDTRGIELVYKKNSGRIVAAIFGTMIYRLGQQVYSNGKVFVDPGTRGTIIKIWPPQEGDRTTNIFDVRFEGQQNVLRMKFSDLEPI